MHIEIIVTIISSVCLLIGTILTVVVSNGRIKNELLLKQQFQQQEIDELKTAIKQHNDYAISIPLIKSDIDNLREMLKEIKESMR